MENRTLTLSTDEIADIRFALAKCAQRNRDMADHVTDGGEIVTWLTEQADRFEALARKVTTCAEGTGNVRIVVISATLHFMTTDLTRYAGASRSVADATDGAVTVPAHLLRDIAKSLPEGVTVELTDSDGHLALRSTWHRNGTRSKCEFRIVGKPAKDFPKVPDLSPVAFVPVDPEMLAELLAGTLPCVSTDETRRHLNGVLMESDGARIRGSATDGHRLARVDRVSTGPVLGKGILIPRDGARDLLEVCKRVEVLEVGVSNGHLHARTPDGETLSVKLIEAAFPPTEQLFRAASEREVTVDRKALMQHVRAVGKLANGHTRPVTIGVNGRALRVSTHTEDVGTFKRDLPAEVSGPSGTITVNAKYLLDALFRLIGANVTLGISGALDPLLLRGEAPDPTVIMPMRWDAAPDALPALALPPVEEDDTKEVLPSAGDAPQARVTGRLRRKTGRSRGREASLNASGHPCSETADRCGPVPVTGRSSLPAVVAGKKPKVPAVRLRLPRSGSGFRYYWAGCAKPTVRLTFVGTRSGGIPRYQGPKAVYERRPDGWWRYVKSRAMAGIPWTVRS